MTQPHDDDLPDDVTTVVPATAAAGRPNGSLDGHELDSIAGTSGAQRRTWFDDRLNSFLDALSFDADRRPRTALERRALATAARDMIERLALRAPNEAPNETTGNWPTAAVLQPNQLLANTYYVRALIARGGIGEIYRARHRDLRTEHAIKILLPQHTLDSTLTAMLQQEARLLSAVRHDSVVNCQGLLRDTDGRLLLVMDHVRGHTLSARLREGPMPLPDLLPLARGLAAALAAIHAAGIVHHDISPDNIILANDNAATPVIIDFGVARPLVESDDMQLLIDFGGKYSWISPEQLAGHGAPSDPRSDLYSLGLVLAAAARGRKLDMGANPETAQAARHAVPPLDGVPAEIAPIIARLLAPTPTGRPASATHLLEALTAKPAPATWLSRWLNKRPP